jgi:replication factor C small subunit
MMERYSAACRFILSCNYSSRIIEPIQSRCAVFRFRGMGPVEMRRQLTRVAKGESLTVDDGAYEAIYEQADGDLRRATNLLQLAAAPGGTVTRAAVEGATTQPIRTEVEAMVTLALAGRFFEARDALFRLFVDRGASGEDILRAVHRYLPDLPEATIATREKIALVDHLAEVDFRLAQGASERVQMESVLARLALIRATGPTRPA